jgi:hypothetical protein
MPAYGVVAEKLLLRLARLDRGFVIRLRILERLLCLVVCVAAGHAGCKQLLLAVQLNGVVIVDRLLLPLCSQKRRHSRLLLPRIDLHQHLAGFHVLARVHQDLSELAAHLGRDGRRAARLHRGHVLAALGYGMQRHRHGLHGQALHSRSGRSRSFLFAAKYRQAGQQQTNDCKNAWKLGNAWKLDLRHSILPLGECPPALRQFLKWPNGI